MWGNKYILLFNILIYCVIYPELGISLLTTTVLLSRKKKNGAPWINTQYRYTEFTMSQSYFV